MRNLEVYFSDKMKKPKLQKSTFISLKHILISVTMLPSSVQTIYFLAIWDFSFNH